MRARQRECGMSRAGRGALLSLCLFDFPTAAISLGVLCLGVIMLALFSLSFIPACARALTRDDLGPPEGNDGRRRRRCDDEKEGEREREESHTSERERSQ